jgi:hypothetical protein
MTEHYAGEGRLVSLSADQREYFVKYEITVDTDVRGGPSAITSPPKVEKRYSLTVKPRNRESIADGEYTLQTDREILRVRKSGQTWTVVQP